MWSLARSVRMSVQSTCLCTTGQLVTYDAMNNYLYSIDWHSVFGFNFSADTIWNEFKNILWPIISLFVPKKIVPHKLKYRPKQYPKKIRILLSRKAAIWRLLRNNNSHELKNAYFKVSHECKIEILNFDIGRENKLLEANNLGAFYKFVNKKLSSKTGIAPLLDSSGNLTVSDSERANLLNEYFHSVFTIDDGNLPAFPRRIPDSNPGICDIRIDLHIIT